MKIIAKKLLSAFFTVQTLLMIMSVAVYAVPASPDAIEYTQPNGSVIQIRQYGDEFQSFAAVIHGENEYVVIPDDQGGYSYARQEYGTYGESSSFSSSAPLISAEQSPPSYAMNPSDYAQTLPEPDRSMTDPSDIRSRAVQDSDLSPYGKAPRVGAEEVLVVLVEFDPDPTQSGEEGELLFNRHNPDIYGTQTPEQHWEEKIFGKNATILSANDFYSENSNGKLWLEPYTIFSTPAGYDTPGVYRVTLPLKHPKVENVPYTDTFYGGLNNRYGAYSASAPPITVDGTTITVANMRVEEVAQSALQRQYGFSYDLAFANNKKLHRMYVISGSDMSADGVNSIGVWGHRTGSDNASSNNRFVFGEVEDGHPSTIGVFCHELGHDLFCPDFYDTRTGTFVAPDPEPEYYSAMASGSWGTGPGDLSGARPTHFDPWNKIGLGWYSATEINPYDPPLQLNAPSIPEDYNILKVSSNDPNQYFLIEQRSDFGFDKGIYRYNSNPTTRSNYYGVVVWRVDNNIIELSTLRNYNSQDRRGMTIINKSSEYVPYQPNDEFFLTFHTGEVVVGNGWETDVSKSAHPRAFKVIGESVKELGEFTAPTNVSETELTLNWTTAANSDAGFTYSIYQSTTEAAIDTVEKCELLTSVAVVDSGTYSHTISGLDAGTYYYSIVVDAAGGTFRKDAIGGNTTSGGKALYTPIEVICSGEPSAAVNSATVTGRQNLAIVGTDITITLNNATFNAFSENENVAGWFTNLPNGITATVKNAVSSGDKSIVITLQGIPSVSADNIKAIISIPVEALGSGASAPLSVEGSVVFNIAPTFGVTLTVNKDGVAYNSHSKTFTLRQNGIAISTGTGADATVTFNDLQRGTYMLYDGTSEQSNTGISVSVSTGNATASINYYTVTFEDMTVDAGNTEITAPVGTISAKYAGVALNSGDVVFGGKELVVTIEGLPENSEFGYVINWTGASGNQEGSGTTRVLKIRPLNATTTVGPSIVGRPGATVADVTISGIVNTLLTTQTANITLGNTKVKDALNSADVSSWFGGTLPNNMTAVATALANSTLIEITFGGTPTAISSTVMNITIPSVALITNESITVKENDKAKFEVVAEAPNYGIELTPADDKDFGSATLNYMAQTEHTVTVKNSGNQATGALTVALGGANPTSFTLSKTSITSLVLNGTDSFTVVPNIGLGVGNYSATVTVSGGNEISESFDVSFEVTALPVYEIELDPADDKDFGSAALNYTAQTPHSVTVTNSGNQATGALTVALGGANPTSFTLSKTSITSLALNGTDSFTVVPNTGLGVGNYSATVTVSGGNEISESFDVSFEVTALPVYEIELDPADNKDFGSVALNYTAQTPHSVTVRNSGDQATGALTVALGGANPTSFTLSKTSITSLVLNGTDSFTVVPNTGLGVGNYSATVTVSGGNDISESFNVSFEVTALPVYEIELEPANDKDFGSVALNYTAQTPHSVTVTNIGNQATGALTVALGGANPTSFTLSKTSITSLALNGTDSFTVVPNTGLGVGNYSATVTVSGGNEISEFFNVSFEVTALPVYEIELNPADDKDFGSATLNYTAQTPHSVTVKNTGNQTTGALTVALGGANPTSFTLSKTSITSLALNGTDSFTVVPNTGLGVGNYSATVTVSGGNEISESFNVSFEVTVTALPVYEIELDSADDKDFGSAALNYTAQTPHSVTVRNSGDQATGALTVALGGANPTSFTLSKVSIESLALNGTDSFTVVPNTGLGVGNYSATVTVSGGNEISESFNVSFEVTALLVYEIELDPADNKDFGSAALNYTAQTPHSVTVRNSGDQATGALTVALGGANPTSFTLSKVSIESLALNGTDSFTVVPNTGLGVGNYLATVTVSGGNETSESFDVSFEVTALPVPVITVDVQPAVLTTVKEGSVSGSISVSATVSNGYAANYQWFSNAVPSTTGGTAVPGETNKSFTIPAGLTSGTYYYFCEITASGGAVSVRSNIAKVVVEPKEPDIITAIVPSVSSDNPIKLDLNAIASAYIAISLGDGNEGNVLAANAEIKVANSEIASVEPANLVSGGNITVIGKSVGFTTILVEFSGGNVIDAAYNVEIEVEVTNSNVPPTVESVTVNPASVTLNRGASQIFTASVTGTNNPPAEVQWSVTGGSSGTFISSGGVLTIATDETAVTLIVTATSAQDGSKFASAYVTVIQPEPEPETYTISYNANGGSGTMLSSAVTQGINYPISPNAFVRFNYTFNGWNTRPDGSGNAYPANGIISNVTSNITLYAQWIINVIYNPINNEPSYFSSFNSSATQVAAEPASDSIVFVDGKETEIGNVTRLGNTSIITIPQDAFSGSVENATHDVAVIMPDNTQNGEVQLVIKNVDDLTSNNLYLSIQMDDIKYNIPPAAVDTAFIMRELGASDPSQVKLNININTNLESTEITKTEETIKANGLELVSKPMEFSLTAVYNGISSHITSFGKYVSRTAELPESTVSKTTTAVVIEQNGNVRHIPTRVYSESGKWYAEINSLTNSVYALVYKAEHFSDAEGKWYEGAVNEMVSRMIISGTGNNEYTGERPVTRAEFSSIIVRALGLRPTGNTAIFDDVSVNQWYSGYVAAAFEHGIISGRGERKFDPESYITWQEAMIMIRNAAKITELNSLPQGLDVYPDAVYVSDWARDSVKFYSGAGLFIRDGLLQPTENINRAETAAAILKLLQKSGIIDVRSKLD